MTIAISPDLQRAVEAFRIEYSHPDRLKRLGARDWKEALATCWATGEDASFKGPRGESLGGLLRTIRNTPSLGHDWLKGYVPQPLFGHIFNAWGGGHAVHLTPTESLAGEEWPAGIHTTKAAAKAHIKNAGAKPYNF